MSDLHVHLVFVTKYRRGALTAKILARCEDIMGDVCADFGASLVEFNGEDDHVHLLVEYSPTMRIASLVGSLKGVSSRYLRQEFHGHLRKYIWSGHLWSPSYYAGSAGGAPLEVIRRYIESQQSPT